MGMMEQQSTATTKQNSPSGVNLENLRLPAPTPTPNPSAPEAEASGPTPQTHSELVNNPYARIYYLQQGGRGASDNSLESAIYKRKLEIEKDKALCKDTATKETSFKTQDEKFRTSNQIAQSAFTDLSGVLTNNAPEITGLISTYQELNYQKWLNGSDSSQADNCKLTMKYQKGLLDPTIEDNSWVPFRTGVTFATVITDNNTKLVEKVIGTSIDNFNNLINKHQSVDSLCKELGIDNELAKDAVHKVIKAYNLLLQDNPDLLGDIDNLKAEIVKALVTAEKDQALACIEDNKSRENEVIARAMARDTSPLYDDKGELLDSSTFKNNLRNDPSFKQRVINTFRLADQTGEVAEKKAIALNDILNRNKESLISAEVWINGAQTEGTTQATAYKEYLGKVDSALCDTIDQQVDSLGMSASNENLVQEINEKQNKLLDPALKTLKSSYAQKLEIANTKYEALENKYPQIKAKGEQGLFSAPELAALAINGDDSLLASLIHKRLGKDAPNLLDQNGLPTKEMEALVGYVHGQISNMKPADLTKSYPENKCQSLIADANSIHNDPSYSNYRELRNSYLAGTAKIEEDIDSSVSELINRNPKFVASKLNNVQAEVETADKIDRTTGNKSSDSSPAISVDKEQATAHFRKELTQIDEMMRRSDPVQSARLELVDTIANCYLSMTDFNTPDGLKRTDSFLKSYQNKSAANLLEELKTLQNNNNLPEYMRTSLGRVLGLYSQMASPESLLTTSDFNDYLSSGAGGEMYVHRVFFDTPANADMPLLIANGDQPIVNPEWAILKSLLLAGVNDPTLSGSFNQPADNATKSSPGSIKTRIEDRIFSAKSQRIIRNPPGSQFRIDWQKGELAPNPYYAFADDYARLSR